MIPLAFCFGTNTSINFLIISPFHNHCISQNASVHLGMVLMSRTSCSSWGLLGLDFFATKSCTSFKCLVNSHFAQYATVQLPTLHFHFDLTFVHSLSFRAKLGGQRRASGWEACSVSSSGPKPKKWKFKKQNAGIAKHQITKSHITP